MIVRIPTSTVESWYEQTTRLGDRDFHLTFSWSERDRHWYLSLATADGETIMDGRRVVVDTPLTVRLTHPLRPTGHLWCVDMTGDGRDPDLRDLGTRCLFMYADEATE